MRFIQKLILATMLCGGVAFADNPAVQTCFTSDPAPMVYNGTVFVYTTHDSDNATNSYLIANWKCYSSKDMVNWTDHGVVLSPKNVTWSTARDADAIQVVYRNGKFYFYINTTASDGVAIGVAVSSSPIGPFKDTLGRPLIPASKMTGCNATHGWRGLDPTVFIDDDGQAYLYWGNNVLYWVKLNEDMISYSGAISCLPQNDKAFGPDYEEGPWFYKRNNLYYLIYPSTASESIHYSTSTGPTGPWTYKGLIMPVLQGAGSSMTIHPGVCDFGGKSYFFYHNGALPGGGSYKRSMCIEQFAYNADGTIPKINGTTGGVVDGVGNLNPYDTTQAETICWESGVKTKVCSEGGICVDSIHNNDYIKVEGVDFGTGAKSFEARVASAAAGGAIELRLDSQTGTLVGTCSVTATGGIEAWATKSCDISGATGKHDLYLKFTGGSGLLFNFNWWKFKGEGTGVGKTERSSPDSRSTQLTINAGTAGIMRFSTEGSDIGERVVVRLFDSRGRAVGTLFDGYPQCHIPVLCLKDRNLAPGVYLLKVTSGNNLILTEKVQVAVGTRGK
jgi:hypothetical protein